VWQQLSLLDPSKVVWDKVGSAKGVGPGGIMGSGLFQQDPYQWTQQFLVPALIKAGYDTQEKQRQAIQYLFPSRTAGFIMGQMAMQGWKFDRDQDLIRQAAGLSGYDALIRRDPDMAYRALGAQWENLKAALGITIVPVVISFIQKLTGALNALATFAQRHPTLTKGLMVTFTGLSALATIGGGLLIAGGAFKLIGVAMTTLTGLPLATAATGLTALTAALAPLIATAAFIANHKSVAGWIDEKNPAIGDWLFKAFSPEEGAEAQYRRFHSAAPPSSGKTIQVHTQLNMDGRTFARLVTQHQYYDMNRDLSSGSGFDSRLSFSPPSVP
ncbi:MAG TPA: hypothetical protein VFA26_17790, partial [Gemmataceae bacterium]|nr:hypothetical protein [Gemmataceae bacterium]